MPIHINSNFDMGAPIPIDTRFNLTYQQMANMNDNIMPLVYITMCIDDGFIYVYNKNNTHQEQTGKFIKFGSGSDYSTQLIFSTYAEFPVEGQPETLYISEDQNVIYRWDTTNQRYEELSPLDIYTEIYDVNSFTVLTTQPSDWTTQWTNYFTLTYVELVSEPFNFNPTRHYWFNGTTYIAGVSSDTWSSHTWCDKYYLPVTSTTPIPFSPQMYYTGTIKSLVDGESLGDSLSKLNSNVQILQGKLINKVSVRVDSSDPECLVIYKS